MGPLAYVDLNSIRAGIVATREASNFTSIQPRINELAATRASSRAPLACARRNQTVAVPLLGFRGSDDAKAAAMRFTLTDYVDLVDWTGRVLRPDKRSAIDSQLPPIIRRLKIDAEA